MVQGHSERHLLSAQDSVESRRHVLHQAVVSMSTLCPLYVQSLLLCPPSTANCWLTSAPPDWLPLPQFYAQELLEDVLLFAWGIDAAATLVKAASCWRVTFDYVSVNTGTSQQLVSEIIDRAAGLGAGFHSEISISGVGVGLIIFIHR